MLLRSVRRRARSTGRRWVVLGVLLACVVTMGSVVGAGPSVADDPAAAESTSTLVGFTVQVGPEERVYGPSGLTDAPYFSERVPSGKLLGFISNNDSYRVATRNNKTIRGPRLILKRGKVGSFDKCGAWLMGSVYKRTATNWVALYHAEAAGKGDNNRCIFSDDSVVASVGRAVSHDAGQTWKKAGQVISQDSDLDGPKSEDALNGRMMQYGPYLYYFYAASTGNSGDGLTRRLHVARSAISDQGERGTWKKWHCYKPTPLAPKQCDFGGTGNEGLGGDSTPVSRIDPMARVIIPNTYLDHNIALSATGSRGFRLWISNGPASLPPVDPADPALHADPTQTAWRGTVDIYPPVSSPTDPQVDNWNRTRRAKQLYAYPSIVSANGESHTSGQVFYIYYVKLFPGGGFPDRYLMRRKVTLTKTDTSGLHRVALTTYYEKATGLRRTSTERPIKSSFKANGSEGYLLAEPNDAYKQVFECFRRGTYRLRVDKCAIGEKAYRRVGWISPSVSPTTPTPIFSCFNRRKKNYFVTTADDCLSYRKVGLLGYGLKEL